MKQLPRSTLTLALLAAILAGVALSNFFSAPKLFLLEFISVVSVVALLFRKPRILGLFSLIALGIALGMLRAEYTRFDPTPMDIAYHNTVTSEKNVTIIGLVAEDPDRRLDHTKLILEAETLRINSHPQAIVGKILFKTSRLPEYAYGDRVSVTGKLQAPFETDEFSYKNYLARYDIYSVMYYPRITKLASKLGNPFFAGLYRVRNLVENQINQIFPEPEASFTAGLLTGSRRGIPDDVLQNFTATGLTHIIAISGYNIALVIALVTAFIGTRVPRRWQFPLVAFFVILFTFFVGAGPSVVRAAIMGLLAFFALTHGRQTNATLLLFFTATVMVLWNPRILLADVSFQLSFAAVLGLTYLSPLLEHWTRQIPNRFAIRESLILTLSAQIATAPLILWHFGRLSLIAPLANLLVAPAIPLAMLLGTLAVFASFVYVPAGLVIGFAGHMVLSYMLFIAEKLAF